MLRCGKRPIPGFRAIFAASGSRKTDARVAQSVPGTMAAQNTGDRKTMRAYAGVFFTCACFSACFVDSGLKPSVARIGRIALSISMALFAASEIMIFLA
jgi:hypothetical protein